MLLAVDVGNTNLTVGAFEGNRLLKLWRLATEARRTSDELGVTLRSLVGSAKPSAVIYGSVVPALNPVFEAASRGYLGVKAAAVTASSPLGIRLKVDRPSEVGVDRLLNSLAVLRLCGAPAVVLDFGTATTFDCVSAKGEYLGGAILIGPEVASEALSRRTALLPRVDLRKPGRFIGKNTVECIQAGLYYGYLGMVERILEGTLSEMLARKPEKIGVIATGGLAGKFAPSIARIQRVIPDLTLQGLRLAHEILSGVRTPCEQSG